MAYTRRRRRRRFRSRRRHLRRGRSLVKKLYKLHVRDLKIVEDERFTVDYTTPSNTTAYVMYSGDTLHEIIDLTDIEFGTADNLRTHDRITMHSCDLYVEAWQVQTAVAVTDSDGTGGSSLQYPAFFTTVASGHSQAQTLMHQAAIEFVLIKATCNTATPPTIGNLYDSRRTPGWSVRNLLERPEWKIAWRKTVKLRTFPVHDGAAGDTLVYTYPRRFRVNVPLNSFSVKYIDNSTANGNRWGSLYLMAWSTQATATTPIEIRTASRS